MEFSSHRTIQQEMEFRRDTNFATPYSVELVFMCGRAQKVAIPSVSDVSSSIDYYMCRAK